MTLHREIAQVLARLPRPPDGPLDPTALRVDEEAQVPPVAERLPDLCVFMNPEDAGALSVRDKDPVEITDVAGFILHKLPVRIEPTLPPGLLGVTAGLPPFQNMRNDARVALKKASTEREDRP